MRFKLIQSGEDFPNLPDVIEELFLDIETTSYDSAKSALNPFKDCWPAGFAFTFDDNTTCYYLPIGHDDQHTEEKNIDRDVALDFIQELLSRTKLWVNHNVKFDAHICYQSGLRFDHIAFFDTLTQAKLIDSERWHYTLDSLCKSWLDVDTKSDFKERMSPWLGSNKDWGKIPIRLMHPYACNDVFITRLLYHYIREHLPPESREVSRTECGVTSALFLAEERGLRVNHVELLKAQWMARHGMVLLTEKIRREHGLIMRPNVNVDCHELLHHQYGLPVIKHTGEHPLDFTTGEPSYDKDSLKTLLTYPNAPKDLINIILRYRKYSTDHGYITSLVEKHINEVIHSDYNSAVRTGRMSCKNPNNQQWDKVIKRLIIPREGYAFLIFDYSSIEFRIIAHYLAQPEILRQYEQDPDADFHQIVANLCSVERGPAKNINFAMAFGGGQKKVLKMLASDASVIRDIEASSAEEFQELCGERALHVFTTYHNRLHKLKPITKYAARLMRNRGYVRNYLGRRRLLPKSADPSKDLSYRGFNAVVQSGAADLLKKAVVRTCPKYNEELRALDCHQVLFVHDSIGFEVPKENAYTAVPIIVKHLVEAGEGLSIPMRVSAEYCADNWGTVDREFTRGFMYG